MAGTGARRSLVRVEPSEQKVVLMSVGSMQESSKIAVELNGMFAIKELLAALSADIIGCLGSKTTCTGTVFFPGKNMEETNSMST